MAYGEEYLDEIRSNLRQGRRQWRRGDKLLEAFGYTRRRQTAIDLINDLLKAKGMYTDPALDTSMSLTSGVTFYLKRPPRTKTAQNDGPPGGDGPVEEIEVAGTPGKSSGKATTIVMIPQEAPTAEKGSATERYIVANLPCAEKYPEQIAASAPLSRALTKMALYDYSQLVVGSGRREIKGLISYRSVAQAFFQSEPKIVGDCIDDTVPHVKLDEPLFRVADLFRYYDAVLVFRSDKALSGIVTPFDIAVEFGVTAAPVLLIGQIEEQLRWLLENRLDLAEALIRVGGNPSAVDKLSAEDLTMGELQRLLDNDQNWVEVGIRFDREEFCKEFNAIREIRNKVMHFKELPDESLDRLKRFATAVQSVYVRLAH